MTKVRVAGFSVSFDGFGAGPEQSLENPLGKRGQELHPWFIRTRSFQAMFGKAMERPELAMLKRKGRRHPFYWASFIESGEWANLGGKR